MKIIIMGGKGFPYIAGAGGVEKCIFEFVNYLTKLGHECIVYERAHNFRFSKYKKNKTTIISVPFINTKNLATVSHAFFSLFHLLISRIKPTFVHVHNANAGVVCPILFFLGYKVVFHVHGKEWKAKKWNKFIAFLIKISCYLGIRFSHMTLTVCKSSYDIFVNKFSRLKEQIFYLPNGKSPFNTRDMLLKNENFLINFEKSNFLLYVGRIVPQKRIELAIQALTDLSSNILLVIAGDISYTAKYYNYLVNFSKNKSVYERVIYLGYIDYIFLHILYKKCLAVILPSETEGCSNVLIEAISEGCCVVSSDIPENRDVLGHSAVYFSPNHPEQSLSYVLKRLLADMRELNKFKNLAKNHSNSIPDWKFIVNKYLEICNSMLLIDRNIDRKFSKS